MDGFFDGFQVGVLCLFTGFLIVRLVQVRLRHGVSAVSLGFRAGRKRGFLTLSLVVLITAWVIVMLLYTLHPEISLLAYPLAYKLVDSLAAKIAGVSIVVLAFVIYAVAWVRLGNSWRVGDSQARTGDLVTDGIYSISRNPIYVYFGLYFTGTFLINGALAFLIFTAVVIVNIHLLTLTEEEFLRRTYGGVFGDYCRETDRYITWRKLRPGFLLGRR
jgi:protein-S-isoprenylcysteine O-methyltransferase Ste14